eukprot:32023_2
MGCKDGRVYQIKLLPEAKYQFSDLDFRVSFLLYKGMKMILHRRHFLHPHPHLASIHSLFAFD